MSTELVKSAPGALASVTQIDWAKETVIQDIKDILTPRILLAQPTTKVVGTNGIQQGMFYRSTTKQPIQTPLTFVPLNYNKTWILSEKIGSKFEFQSVEAFTPENEGLPWYTNQAGKECDQAEAKFKREASLNFFVLIVDDMERYIAAKEKFRSTGEFPDVEDCLWPAVLSFKSTSYAKGKVLVNHFAACGDLGVPVFSSSFVLTAERISDERGTFYVQDLVRKKEKLSDIQMSIALNWWQKLRGKAVNEMQVDVAEERVELPNAAAPEPQTPSASAKTTEQARKVNKF